VVRLDRLAEQSVRRLGISSAAKPAETSAPDLRGYLAALKAAPVAPSPAPAAPKQEPEPRVVDVVQLGGHLIEIIDDE
jgi:hypothetical protein